MLNEGESRSVGLRQCWCRVLGLALIVIVTPLSATEYLKAVEDIPLAPGLVEDRSATTVFDKPAGRIVEMRASGRRISSAVVVATFYGETLPQLGWKPQFTVRKDKIKGTTELRFTRSRELLSLVITETGGGVVVRFAITPR
mgnify:FL=1|tara:strand:+ start:586 stop:1011 length:426 start_codon:yes stop_codon:yes gene_type:complete